MAMVHDDAGCAPAAGLSAAGDNDSDWEYEYSTTETETHLITLDLSLPEFVRRRKEHIMHNTRGGFRSWMNPIMGGDDAPPAVRRGPGWGEEGEGEGDAHQDDDHDDDNDNDNDNDDANHDDGHADPDNDDLPRPDDPEPDPGHNDDPVAPEIQVLDLHAAQPLFAYRGVVLTGAWSEPIGTELVFGEREGDGEGDKGRESLSSRSLPDGVVLLGAATARIQCTPAELRGRHTVSPPTPAEPSHHRPHFSIPVATNASGPRQRQAAFLEKLMAAKHRAGEADVVTVQALETTQDAVPAGDDEEAARRARRQAQAAKDARRVVARREREREQKERRQWQAQAERARASAEDVQRAEHGRAPLTEGTMEADVVQRTGLPDNPDIQDSGIPNRRPPSPISPVRRKRGRTAVDGVAGGSSP